MTVIALYMTALVLCSVMSAVVFTFAGPAKSETAPRAHKKLTERGEKC